MARILVVDDEQLVRKTLGRSLKEGGHECMFASNAFDAEKLFQQESFELVLSDVNMPGEGGSGIDFIKRIKKVDPFIPIVMVTGVSDTTVAETALELGAYGYLLKPFDATEINIAVINALRRGALERESRERTLRLEVLVSERTYDLQRAQEALRHSREEMIQRLAKAAEFRDNETAEHLQRMSRYCELIARKLGLPGPQCDDIRVASLMHDVGKIGIPDRILLKPGKLTPEEFDIMKTHTDIGYRILSGSEHVIMDLAAKIAITHHEKYDGNGYPKGLAGEQIPLEGRLAAIADVFDAVTSRRVYKDAMPVAEAVKMLKDGRGTHFDPVILDLFLNSLDEVQSIKEAFADKVGG